MNGDDDRKAFWAGWSFHDEAGGGGQSKRDPAFWDERLMGTFGRVSFN